MVLPPDFERTIGQRAARRILEERGYKFPTSYSLWTDLVYLAAIDWRDLSRKRLDDALKEVRDVNCTTEA